MARSKSPAAGRKRRSTSKAGGAGAGKKKTGSGKKRGKTATKVTTEKKNILDMDMETELDTFLESMTDEPHCSRRKDLIKAHGKEIKKLFGHDPRSKYIVLVLMMLHLGTAIAMRDQVGSLLWWVVVYVWGASIGQSIFLACHEISHNLFFKKFSHNKMFGIFTNCSMAVPFFIAFKHYHNEHHKSQGVDGIDTDIPTALEARWLSSTPGKWLYMFNQTWHYAVRPVLIRRQAVTKWHVINVVVVLGFDFLLYKTFGWGPLLYLLAADHFSGSIHPLASHFLAEHVCFTKHDYGPKYGVQYVETASYYGPLNWLTWNVGYHNEHHDMPNIPGSRLPQLRKLGDYDQLPQHESWTAVLLEFLFNPKITLYNRVTRPDKEALGKTMGAQGDADYNEKVWWSG